MADNSLNMHCIAVLFENQLFLPFLFFCSSENFCSVQMISVCLYTRCCCCSVAQSCPTLCDPMECSTPGFSVPHHLLKFAQVNVHCIGDALQPSHPLMPSSSSALNLSQHQRLFQWVSCLHQMIKILEFQFQHQSFERIFRVNFPWDWLVWSPCSPRDWLSGVFSSTTVRKHQ